MGWKWTCTVGDTQASCAPRRVPEPFTHFDKAFLLRKDQALKQAVDAWMSQAIGSGKWKRYMDAAMH